MGREYSLCKNKTLFLDIATYFLVLSEETQSIFGKEKIMVKSGKFHAPQRYCISFSVDGEEDGFSGAASNKPAAV